MNELTDAIAAVLTACKSAVQAKAVDAFVALYDTEVQVFDMGGGINGRASSLCSSRHRRRWSISTASRSISNARKNDFPALRHGPFQKLNASLKPPQCRPPTTMGALASLSKTNLPPPMSRR